MTYLILYKGKYMSFNTFRAVTRLPFWRCFKYWKLGLRLWCFTMKYHGGGARVSMNKCKYDVMNEICNFWKDKNNYNEWRSCYELVLSAINQGLCPGSDYLVTRNKQLSDQTPLEMETLIGNPKSMTGNPKAGTSNPKLDTGNPKPDIVYT